MKRAHVAFTGRDWAARAVGRAFTLIELLVVVAVIGILAALLLPAVARSKAQAQGAFCLNNLRQLSLGWMMYADDYRGYLTYNMGGAAAQTNLNWVADLLDWTTNPSNTNLSEIKDAALGQYVNHDTTLYRCPADRALSSPQLAENWSARARSYSMNASVGNAGAISSGGYNTNNPGYVQFFKATSIPRPANIFVFIEESADTIYDGYFVNRIDYAYKEWQRLPASYHNGTAALSFADGHAEFHQWLNRTTKQQIIPSPIPLPIEVARGAEGDFDWLASHMTIESD